MKIKLHAADRALERSRLPPKHVRDIITGRAFVDLGIGRTCRFLLFHSPPDEKAKIALVSLDEEYLVSVWNSNYVLPRGVSAVTPERETRAREVLEQCLRARFGGIVNPAWLSVSVEIRSGDELVAVRDGGAIETADARSRSLILGALKDRFLPIVTETDKTARKALHPVGYKIHLINPRTLLPVRSPVIVQHETAEKQILKAVSTTR